MQYITKITLFILHYWLYFNRERQVVTERKEGVVHLVPPDRLESQDHKDQRVSKERA